MKMMGSRNRVGLHAAPCLPFAVAKPAARRSPQCAGHPGAMPQRQHWPVGLLPASPCRRNLVCRVAAPEAPQEATDDEEDLELSYVDELNIKFGIPGMIIFSEGENGLPRVWLRHWYSAMGAEIYLHGATLTQWLRPDGTPALAQHPSLSLSPDSSNKGAGLRLAFPVYRSGTAMTLDDGFAGRLPWEVVAAGLGFMPGPDGMSGDEPNFDSQLRAELALGGNWAELGLEPEDGLDGGLVYEQISLEDDDDEEEEGEQAAGAQAAEATAEEGQAVTTAEGGEASAAPKKRGRKKKSPSPGSQQEDQAATPPPAAASSEGDSEASSSVASQAAGTKGVEVSQAEEELPQGEGD